VTCSTFAASATERITVQSPTETETAYGGRSVVWADVGTYWAYITPVGGREIFAQQATQSRVTHKIMIRYQAALKNIATISDYRVSYDGRLFSVVSIKNLGQDMKREGTAFQELLVEENGADVAG
jgi:SPP1 family predicted phage head-tail adaptor